MERLRRAHDSTATRALDSDKDSDGDGDGDGDGDDDSEEAESNSGLSAARTGDGANTGRFERANEHTQAARD